MKKLVAPAALALALAGCASAEDIRNEPARFSMTVPAAWDRVSTCLKSAYLDNFSVVDLPFASERRTELLLHVNGTLGQVINFAVFDIRGSDAGTTVTWRRRKLVANQESNEQTARRSVERCARA